MKQPLKWHGGKHYLARSIVALMPSHTHYVEPYAGGLSVLLAKPCEGISEVVSDRNGRLTNFWRVLQDEKLFRQFERRVQAMPFSEAEWQDARDNRHSDSSVERAVQFFVFCRQSLSGRCEEFTTLSRNRVRRGMNEQVSAWLTAIEGLPEVHARLRRVVVLRQPALTVLRSQDGPNTLFYLDPPYLPETKTSRAYGPFEMTVEEHAELLATINRLHGQVMISGYGSRLYDTTLSGWARHEFRVPNHEAVGETKRDRTEVVWCNYSPLEQESTDAATRALDRRHSLLI